MSFKVKPARIKRGGGNFRPRQQQKNIAVFRSKGENAVCLASPGDERKRERRGDATGKKIKANSSRSNGKKKGFCINRLAGGLEIERLRTIREWVSPQVLTAIQRTPGGKITTRHLEL